MARGAGARRAKPRTRRNTEEDGTKAERVVTTVTAIAEKELILSISEATGLTENVINVAIARTNIMKAFSARTESGTGG